jgi:hypothetical protein
VLGLAHHASFPIDREAPVVITFGRFVVKRLEVAGLLDLAGASVAGVTGAVVMLVPFLRAGRFCLTVVEVEAVTVIGDDLDGLAP